MNKEIIIVFLLMIVLVILVLGSCFSSKKPVDVHNSRNSLDWEGVYSNVVESPGGPIIDISIKLNRDQSFEMNHIYLYEPYAPFYAEGSFKWDDTGNIIIIDIIDAPVQYLVTEDALIRLDVNKKYVLKKNAKQ